MKARIINQWSGEEGLESALESWKGCWPAVLAAMPCLLRDSVKEHNCLFWRAGSDTASVTNFATVMQGKSWENPTKWNCICLWSSRDSKFGQWNLVGKWEMHQGLHSEPKIYCYGERLFPEKPASCGNISVEEETGEGPTAHCWCDQPVKIFEQMEKSKFFRDTFWITAHQDIYMNI